MSRAPLTQDLTHALSGGGAVRGERGPVPVLYVADRLTHPRYAQWQGGDGWRAGRLPPAVDYLNVGAVMRFRARVQAFRNEHGPLALVTYRFPEGTSNSYRTGSILGPEMLRRQGHTAAMWAVHLSTRPHVHGLVRLKEAPTYCPLCGGALSPREHREHGHRDGRPARLRKGFGCEAGCTHFSPVQETVPDLKAAAGYLGGPADPGAWRSISERMNAAEKYLKGGRGVQMRGTSLTRAPKYPGTATPVEVLIRRARRARRDLIQTARRDARWAARQEERRTARRARRALTRTNRRASLYAARTARRVIRDDFAAQHAARFWAEVHRTNRNTPARVTVRRSPRPVSPVPCKASGEETGPPRRS